MPLDTLFSRHSLDQYDQRSDRKIASHRGDQRPHRHPYCAVHRHIQCGRSVDDLFAVFVLSDLEKRPLLRRIDDIAGHGYQKQSVRPTLDLARQNKRRSEVAAVFQNSQSVREALFSHIGIVVTGGTKSKRLNRDHLHKTIGIDIDRDPHSAGGFHREHPAP